MPQISMWDFTILHLSFRYSKKQFSNNILHAYFYMQQKKNFFKLLSKSIQFKRIYGFLIFFHILKLGRKRSIKCDITNKNSFENIFNQELHVLPLTDTTSNSFMKDYKIHKNFMNLKKTFDQ